MIIITLLFFFRIIILVVGLNRFRYEPIQRLRETAKNYDGK